MFQIGKLHLTHTAVQRSRLGDIESLYTILLRSQFDRVRAGAQFVVDASKASENQARGMYIEGTLEKFLRKRSIFVHRSAKSRLLRLSRSSVYDRLGTY